MSKGRVGIAALKLIDPDTRKIISHERLLYAKELTRLLIDVGYEVSWWQLGDGWQGELAPGVPLFGILPGEMQLHTYPKASDCFLEKSGGVDWAIYFDFILGYPQAHENSLAICHGLAWDSPLFASSLPTEEERDEWKRRLWMALQAPQKVVALEPGVIQWATATWPGLYHKFLYIPSFVPEERPVKNTGNVNLPEDFKEDREGALRILFPGNLTPAAGISESVRAMETLLARRAGLQFIVTGRGSSAGIKYMRDWAAKQPRACFAPQLMTNALLKYADIVLMPGKGSEGAYLDCLQGMAAGKPVIVGQSSSLTGLVLKGYNGLTIRPEQETIVEAVEYLLLNPAKRRELGERAKETALAFSLSNWRRRWGETVENIFAGRSDSIGSFSSHDAGA